MGKRIRGVFVLLAGLGLTVFHAVKMAYRIPSNFTVEGEGMTFLVNLVGKYDLRMFILAILFGVGLCLSGLYRLISPRMRRVSVVKPVGEGETVTPTELPPDTELLPTRGSEALICSFRTHLMGATFRGTGGKSGRTALSEMDPGEPLMCRRVSDHQFPSSIGVFTLQGHLLGYLDDAFVRELEGQYPNHRISVAIDRVTDRKDTVYRCLLRVGVYEASRSSRT
jgi:hypothetical protein